jgi:ferrochelatase
MLGVLLVNLGTPDAPTPRAVRRYLAEFLWDRRVVELPRLPWWLVLHGIILRLRPARSARLYRRIWTPEGSPLLVITRKLAAGLQVELEQRLAGPVKVVVAMRYGQPSLAGAFAELQLAGAERVLVFPLYPQYSATTTASIFDGVAAALSARRALPELRCIRHYPASEDYIEALCSSIQQHWEGRQPGERLLFSFHGIPERNSELGDPYREDCQDTVARVAARLGLGEGSYALAFQSRFGPARWLQPYTDATLRAWAQAGVDRVDVVCPGFAAVCLETLEEVAQLNREQYLQAGGREYHYIPALNDRPAHIRLLAALVCRHTRGWPEGEPAASGTPT